MEDAIAGLEADGDLAHAGCVSFSKRQLCIWRDVLAGKPAPRAAKQSAVSLWPQGKVYYTFDAASSLDQRRAFREGAAEWALFANLTFIERTTQTNYITVVNTNKTDDGYEVAGGMSALGMAGGQQKIYLNPAAWNRATICHEIGHALGLHHEHQRTDRDSYVVVDTNGAVGEELRGLMIVPDNVGFTDYDFVSIMHYNTARIQPRMEYSRYVGRLGQSDPVLSKFDREGIKILYGAGPALVGVVSNTMDSGPGSLRAALYYAFDHPGTTVSFSIPQTDPGYQSGFFRIALSEVPPALYDGTVLDGSVGGVSGPGVYLDGSSVSPNAYGRLIRLKGTRSVVKNLAIGGFDGTAIALMGTNAMSNVVTGCRLGMDPGGAPVPNAWHGVEIEGGAQLNVIGGTNISARNIISGNKAVGVRIGGSHSNFIQGNYIGVDPAGGAAVPNGWHGIALFNGARGNQVGGATPSARNVVSGNQHQGILIADVGTSDNIVRGNYLGTDQTGARPIPNAWEGIGIIAGASGNAIIGNLIAGNVAAGVNVGGSHSNVVQGNYVGVDASGRLPVPNGWGVGIYDGARGNLVGGSAASERNIISGNLRQGVWMAHTNTDGNTIQGNYVGVDSTGALALSNGWEGIGIYQGAGRTTVVGNVISGNGAAGISIGGAHSNVVQGNNIGVAVSGKFPASNGWGVGIYDGARGNLVGGPAASERNIISGNLRQGVWIAHTNTDGNIIQGNYVGVDSTGASVLSNGWEGIGIYEGATRAIVAGNVVSGNGGAGIRIGGAHGNVVRANLVGVSALGSAAVPNAWHGVALFDGARSNTVGGLVASARNIISGNLQQGVVIDGTNTFGNSLLGNYVGLSAAGSAAIGNGWPGVEIINGACSNIVGGPGAARNFISGNLHDGLAIWGSGTGKNLICGNTIGLGADHVAAVPNLYAGIRLDAGARGNIVGGTNLGAANIIAGNSNQAVRMFGNSTRDNSVRGNSMYSNGADPIALYSDANNAAPAPTLIGAVLGTNTVVSGILAGVPSAAYVLDFYAGPSPADRGMTYFGSASVTAGADGRCLFSIALAGRIPVGRQVAATATDSTGNTSVFSAERAVSAASTPNDGIPDIWRALHFGGNGMTTNGLSAASADPDRDGLSNLQEFLAGTDPRSAGTAGLLRIVQCGPTNSVVGISVAPGSVCRLWAADDLVSGPWSVVADQMTSASGDMEISDPKTAETSRRFYRLQFRW